MNQGRIEPTRRNLSNRGRFRFVSSTMTTAGLLAILIAALPAQDEQRIEKLIEGLSNDSPAVREQSARQLLNLGKAAIPALCEAYRSSTDPEVKVRAWSVLRQQIDPTLKHIESADRLGELRDLADRLSEEHWNSLVREYARDHPVEAGSPGFPIGGDATLYWMNGGTGCFSRGVLRVGILRSNRDGDGERFRIEYDGNATRLTVKKVSIPAPRAKRILQLVRKTAGLKVHEKPRDSAWSMTVYDYRHVLLSVGGRKVYEKSFGGMVSSSSETERVFFDIMFKGVLERGLEDFEPVECGPDGSLGSEFLSIVKETYPNAEWWVKSLLVETAYRLDRDRTLPFIKQLVMSGDEGIERVAEAIDPQDLDWSVEGLQSREPRVRATACQMLAYSGNPEHGRSVAPLLKDPDPAVRIAAVHCIRQLHSGEYADQVAKLLADPEASVRAAACAALGSLGAHRYVGSIAVLLKSDDDELCRAACKALAELKGSAYADEAANLLKHRDRWVRVAACKLLAQFSAKRHAPEIAMLLSDDEEYLRRAACTALGKMGAIEHARVVAGRLKDPVASVRIAACEALARFNAKEYAEEILRQWDYQGLRSHDDSGLGEAASEALVKLGAADQGERIVSYLDSDNDHARAFACRTLGRLGLSAYAEQIAARLSDRSTLVRRHAIKALEELNAAEYRADLENLLQDPEVRIHAAIALAKMGFDSGVSALREETRNKFDISLANQLAQLRDGRDPYHLTVRPDNFRMLDVHTLAAEMKEHGFELVIPNDVGLQLRNRRLLVGGPSLGHVMHALHRRTEQQFYYILEGRRITLLSVNDAKRYWLQWLDRR